MRRGFSLLELLLSVALIGALAAVGAPLYLRLQVRNDLNLAAASVAQSWRRAQILSQGTAVDSNWGVRIQSGSVVLFKGADYATRDPSFDEIRSLPSPISPSGLVETAFSRVFGRPQAAGILTLSSLNGETRTLVLNAYGMVQY